MVRFKDAEIAQDRETSYRLSSSGETFLELVQNALIEEINLKDNVFIGHHPLAESTDHVYRNAIDELLEIVSKAGLTC